MIRLLLKTIVLIFLLSGTSFGAVYYVTDSGDGGHDGTAIGDAWSFSEYLASGSTTGAGDTVCLSGAIDGGSSSNNLPAGGSGGTYIILDGTGSGDCSDASAATINTTKSGYSMSLATNGKDYIKFKGISFSGSNYEVIDIRNSEYIDIYDCVANGDYTRGIYINKSNYGNIYSNDFTGTHYADNIADFLMVDGGHDWYVHNNTITDWLHGGTTVTGDSDESVDGYNVWIYENYFEWPTMPYGRALIVNSRVSSYGQGHHVYFYNNYVYGTRAPNQIDSSSYVYVHNNTFYKALNCCTSAEDDDCTYQYYNYASHLSQQTGSFFWIMTNWNNTSHIYMYNNTFYDSSESALKFWDVDGRSISGIYIDNNIIYNGANANDDELDSPPGSTYTVYDYVMVIRYDAGNGGSFTIGSFDKNIINDNRDGDDDILVVNPYDNGANYTHYNISELNSLFSGTNYNDNPDLTDPANGDFSIDTVEPVSPCIDAGNTLNQAYDDAFNSNTSDLTDPSTYLYSDQDDQGDGWEIGAFAYTGTPNPPTPSPTDVSEDPQACPYCEGCDQVDITFAITTDYDAYGRISDTDQTWDQMTSAKTMSTGNGTQALSQIVEDADCDSTVTRYVAVSTESGDNGAESANIQIDIVVSAEGGLNPPIELTIHSNTDGAVNCTIHADESGAINCTPH